MKDISVILDTGFFPKELPPCFSSKSYSSLFLKNSENSDEFISGIDISSYFVNGKVSQSVDFSIPKVGLSRRNLQIPNPLYYTKLIINLLQNWTEIETHCSNSKFSLTKPIISSDLNVFINPLDYNELSNQRIIKASTAHYYLYLDIKNFYGSIYTHAIPWALHGKEFSKMHRGVSEAFGNLIDLDCRLIQDGQTIGIPIGPITSRIISEIIGAKIDLEIEEYISRFDKYKIIRFVDDFYIYGDSISDLENICSKIQIILKNYGLDINHNKLRIKSCPEIINKSWMQKISKFSFRKNRKSQKSDLISYFGLVFSLAKKNKEEAVLRYALKRLFEINIHIDNFEIFKSFLYQSIFFDSLSINYVFDILFKYKELVNIEDISENILKFLKKHCECDNHYEIVWGLYFCLVFKINISCEISQKLSNIDNAIVSTMLLILFEKSLIDITDFRFLETKINDNELYGNYWIFAYENYLRNFIKGAVVNDDFFKFLKNNNVTFINPDFIPETEDLFNGEIRMDLLEYS